MNKSKLNYLVDLLAFLFFVAVAFSGLAIFFFMPGGRQGRPQEFLGIKKSFWIGLHDWSGIIFIILVTTHFLLYWDWIVCMTKNIFQSEKCENETDDNLKP